MTDDELIKAKLHKVEAMFSKLDMAGWLACFHAARVMVLPGFAFMPSTVEECEALAGPYVQALRAKGFDRTQLGRVGIRYLTDSTALVTALWTRYGGSEVLEALGATYLFLKCDGDWQITMVTTHGIEAAEPALA